MICLQSRPTTLPTNPRSQELGCFGVKSGSARFVHCMDGKQRFELLYRLVSGLLCIPSSNADSERGFSMLRKIHTDQRASLDHSTIVALMSLKHNCTECCFDATLEKELHLKCKKATVTYLKDKQHSHRGDSDSSQL